MNGYSTYDYLAFVVPGGIPLVALQLTFVGWPPGAVDAGLLALLLGSEFVLGHALAATASLVEPLAWGASPGSRVMPEWALASRYSRMDIEEVRLELVQRYGRDLQFSSLYNLAYTELQQAGKDTHLAVLNSQIGFYRNATMACIWALGIFVYGGVSGTAKADPLAWILVTATGGALFLFRYRRFWGQFGDNVIRGIRVMKRASAA